MQVFAVEQVQMSRPVSGVIALVKEHDQSHQLQIRAVVFLQLFPKSDSISSNHGGYIVSMPSPEQLLAPWQGLSGTLAGRFSEANQ
jgi:hypothetical protein